METQVVDEEIQQVTRRQRSKQPFTIRVATGARCPIYQIGYSDGSEEFADNPKSGGPGMFSRDEAEGETYDTYLVEYEPATGRWSKTIKEQFMCRLPPTPRPRQPKAAIARAEVKDLFVMPQPGLGVSPLHGGLTGMPVKLWAVGVPAEPLRFPPTALHGTQVEVQASPLSYEWDTGDGGTTAPQSQYSTQAPGSAEQPAVTHVYETKSSVGRPGEGVYTIRLTVKWARRYRVVGIADPCNNWCDLDPGETSATRTYQVDEVRGVLTE